MKLKPEDCLMRVICQVLRERGGSIEEASRLLGGVGAGPYVYFAHSYYAPVTEATAATCSYTLPYTALLEEGNTFGVQFHPEKSGPVGLAMV